MLRFLLMIMYSSINLCLRGALCTLSLMIIPVQVFLSHFGEGEKRQPFKFSIDASNLGEGAVLLQDAADGIEHPIPKG